MCGFDNVGARVEKHEASGTCKGGSWSEFDSSLADKLVPPGEVQHKAGGDKRTVGLLRVALGQALVPDQRRLLISNQPSNRDPLQQVTLFEMPIHFRVGHDPRQRLPRHVEKLAQLVAPVLLVQVVEQSAARVRGVGDVQAAVFTARQLLRVQ